MAAENDVIVCDTPSQALDVATQRVQKCSFRTIPEVWVCVPARPSTSHNRTTYMMLYQGFLVYLLLSRRRCSVSRERSQSECWSALTLHQSDAHESLLSGHHRIAATAIPTYMDAQAEVMVSWEPATACHCHSSLLLLSLPSHMINAMWLFAQLLFMMFQWCCWWRQSLVLFQSLRCCVLIDQGILPALLNGNFAAFNVAYVFLLQSSFVADCQMHVLFSLSSLS